MGQMCQAGLGWESGTRQPGSKCEEERPGMEQGRVRKQSGVDERCFVEKQSQGAG